ncbi:MAG: hypothetical protein NWR72_04350 [Bacteroidia bacterium]|nr:hypothetical protein [Bacteroidia bacterium]
MNFSKLIFATSLLFVSMAALAQGFEPANDKHHELSISAQGLLGNIIPGAYVYYPVYTTSTLDPLLRYRFHTGKHAFRIGVNASNSKDNTGSTDSTNYANSGSGLNLTIGYEYTFIQQARLQAYVGADAIWGTENTSNTGVDRSQRAYEYSSNTNRIGGRPFVGLRFFLTPAISISTEMSFLIYREKSASKNFRDWTEPQTVDSDRVNTVFTYNSPHILYLDFRF